MKGGSLQNLAALVTINCHLDTAWSHLRGKPQLRNCLDRIALWVCLWEVVLSFDAGGPGPLRVAPTLGRWSSLYKKSGEA